MTRAERLKEILKHLRFAARLVREEMADGGDCGTLANDLQRGQELLTPRFYDLTVPPEHRARKNTIKSS